MPGPYVGITPEQDAKIAETVRVVQGGYLNSPQVTRPRRKPRVVANVIGKPESDASKGEWCTVVIYGGSEKGSESATEQTIEAYNRFGDVSSDSWVWCTWVNGGWELLAAECSS